MYRNILVLISLSILVSSCSEWDRESQEAKSKDSNDKLKSFTIIVVNEDYATAMRLEYILTESVVNVISKGMVEGEHDSIMYIRNVIQSSDLRAISQLNIDSLKDNYNNPCIEDGLQITLDITKDGKHKKTCISNYYQKDIGDILALLNGMLPDKYHIIYNKNELLEGMSACDLLLE